MRGGRSVLARGGGEGETGGATQSVRGTSKSFKGTHMYGFGRNASVNHVYSVSRTTSEEKAECSKG